jgi:hypothetical protein
MEGLRLICDSSLKVFHRRKGMGRGDLEGVLLEDGREDLEERRTGRSHAWAYSLP